MSRTSVGLAFCVGVLAIASPEAQQVLVRPIILPRAIPAEDALIYTEQNDVNSSTNLCASAGRVWRVREVSDTGREQGPSAVALSLDIPMGVTLDAAGRLYVADKNNRRVVRMDDVAGSGWVAFSGVGGSVLSEVGRRSSCTNSDYGVYDVVLDAAGRIYISTASPPRLVRIDDMSGTGWSTFELQGSNYFSGRAIARDAQDRIYLADNQKHRIIRIDDISGRGLVTLGSFGNGPAQFNQPYGIAFDSRGRIYIGDEYNHRVVRMDDMAGTGWTTYGTYGGGAGQLSTPHGVVIDRLDRIYIADTGNRRIVRIDDMNGAGEVAFGYLELQGRRLVTSAVKHLHVVRDGPVIANLQVFPAVTVGGTYRTSVFAVNTGVSATSADVALLRRTTTGDSMRGELFPVTVGGVSGSTFTSALPVAGVERFDVSVDGGLARGYARLRTATSAQGMALVQSVSGGLVTGQAAWGQAPGMDHFTIYIDNTNGARTWYSLTNPRTEDTQPPTSSGFEGGWGNVTMTLRDRDGAVLQTRSDPMGPGMHLVEAVATRFPVASDGFEGSLEITPVALSKLQATAVRYDNGGTSVFTALPVFTHREVPSRQSNLTGAYLPPSEATTLYHPLVADGGGYQTNVILFNPGDVATTATVEFFGSAGAPLGLPIAGATRASFAVSLAPRAVQHVASTGSGGDVSWGWARVTAPAPVRAQAILQTRRDGQVIGETAIPMSDPMRRFKVVVANAGTTESGVALANPNAHEVAATFRLRNQAGTLAGEIAVAVPGRGRLAPLVTQLFPGAGEFDGTLEVEATGGLLTGVGLRYDNTGGTVFTTTPAFLLP